MWVRVQLGFVFVEGGGDLGIRVQGWRTVRFFGLVQPEVEVGNFGLETNRKLVGVGRGAGHLLCKFRGLRYCF